MLDETVEKIAEFKAMVQAGKFDVVFQPIVDLCWKSDLNVTTVTTVQRHIATFSEQTLVVDGGGESYPLTDDEMNWFIDCYQNGDADVVSF